MENDKAKCENESRQPRPQAGEVSRNSSEARIGATLVSPRRGGILNYKT